MTLLERLKAETRPAHDRIEAGIDFPTRTASLDTYRDLLVRFHGFHRAFERAAEAMAPNRDLVRSRRRTPLLARDLSALGLSDGAIGALPQCRDLMPLPAPAAVWGAMYVMEGSTLGGAVIARDVERRLGLCARTGCAYFRSYGRRTAAMWTSFGAALLAASAPETDDLVVETAQRTFDALHLWLCEAA